MNFILTLILLALIKDSYSYSESKEFVCPYYIAVASKGIRPFSNHNVTIFVEQATGGNIVLTFIGLITSQNKSEIYTSNPVDIATGSSASLSIPIESLLERSQYSLTLQVTHKGNAVENRSVSLHVAARGKPRILVQSDKPVYKTGDKVRFRVVTLDRDLRPDDDVNLTVQIHDAMDNIVKLWADQRPTKGLFKSELQLSIEPIIGRWTIEVTATSISNKTFPISSAKENLKMTPKLRFRVDEYVLPKFEVKVNLPPFALFSDTKIPVKVEARYTHGQGIKGRCQIRVSSGGLPLAWNMTLDISNGKGASELDIKFDFGDPKRFFYMDLNFEANVMEELTGIVRNATSTLRVYPQPHKIEQISYSIVFKSGLPFNATFRITTHDGIPVMKQPNKPVKINWSLSIIEYNTGWHKHRPSRPPQARWRRSVDDYNGRHLHRRWHGDGFRSKEFNGNFQQAVGHDGRVQVELSVPPDTYGLGQTLKVQLTYKNATRSFYYNSAAPKSYLEIRIPRKIIAGGPFELYFWATEQVSSVNCVLIYRNSIVCSKQVNFKLARSSGVFQIQCLKSLKPGARLIAYSVTVDGELVTDEKALHVEGNLMENFLNISAPDKVEPGATINLTLKSSPNSLLALRAVDQSVLLLDYADTDITAGGVEKFFKHRQGHASKHRNGVLVISNTKKQQARLPGWGRTSLSGARIYNSSSKRPKGVPDAPTTEHPQPPSPILPKARTKFLESWIWDEYQMNENQTSIQVQTTLPDTLTSWVITGFSLDYEKGLGVVEEPTRIITSRPFFLSMNLPFSVVKGEILGLQILIHNNMDLDLYATVTIDNEMSEFEFADEGVEANAINATKTQYCKANSVTAVPFKLMPTKIGSVTLSATGLTLIAGDALKKELRVKPSGKKVRKSESVLLKDGETIAKDLHFPDERVDGADSVKVMVIGNMMGQVLENLDKLLTMPTGCGEQNMMSFVVDIVVLDYLKATGTLRDAAMSKAFKFLESGYQRQLTYQHTDGSFSAFGKSDVEGSTWLTAFVVRSFLAATPHIFIEEEVISRALRFLTEKQSKSGSFKENGRVMASHMQGGSGIAGLALTAYTTLAFLEAGDRWRKPKIVSKALEFIVNSTSTQDPGQDLYSLIITTYTLHVANHTSKDAYFERVMNLAIIIEESGFKYWDVRDEGLEVVRPVAVEMTSYVLQTFLIRNQIADAYPILRWLLKQRNPDGGFLSTQDTVVGLTALAKFAQLTKSPVTDMTIEVHDGKQERAIRIHDSDAMVLNHMDLPADTRKVTVLAEGNGTAFVAFDWEYYIETEIKAKADFKIQVKATENVDILKTMTCVLYNGNEKSNIAIVELNMPTGFVIDQDFISVANLGPLYKRHDVEEGGAKVSIYFDNFSLPEKCFEIVALKEFQVSNPSPAYALVYDYYDTTKMAEAFYVIE